MLGGELDPVQILLANLLTFVGGVVQGSVGMGGSIVTVPLLGLVSELLVPVPALFAALGRTLLVLRRDFSGLDRRGLRPILAGVVPGALVGALVIANISNTSVVIAASASVLIAIVASMRGWRIRDSVPSRFSIGIVSGCMSSISAVAGPVIALFYLDAKNNVIRATMSFFFIATNSLSLVFLASVGKIHLEELLISFEIIPGALGGFLLSSKWLRAIDRRSVRPVIYFIASLSACVVIVEKLFF